VCVFNINRYILNHKLDNALKTFWEEDHEGNWSPKSLVVNNNGHETMSLFDLSKYLETPPPPVNVNGLGLSGPPKIIVKWTFDLYHSIVGGGASTPTNESTQYKNTIFFRKTFEHFFQELDSRNFNSFDTADADADADVSVDGERHPDLKYTQEWETDSSRFIKMKELNDKIYNKNSKKTKREATTTTTTNNNNNNNALLFANMTKGSSTYHEPSAMVAMDVFTDTMKNIYNHLDTTITSISKNKKRRGLTNFENLKNKNKFQQPNGKIIHNSIKIKKKELTQLLQLFWGAVNNRNIERCNDLYNRLNIYEIENIRQFKMNDIKNVEIQNIIEPFLYIMIKQIAKTKEKLKQMNTNHNQKKLKKRRKVL
jgi:hypothetical protein